MLRLGDAVAEELDSAFINGTGAGMPWAFWKASALLVIAKETTQTAATIETANVLKMLSQSTNVAGSVFVGNPSILPQVGQLVTLSARNSSAVRCSRKARMGPCNWPVGPPPDTPRAGARATG